MAESRAHAGLDRAGGLLLALAAGAAQALALAPQARGWLQVLAAAVLALLVQRASPGRAFRLGGVFSLGWLVGSFWWLFISLHRYGGMPALLAGTAVLLLAAALSLYLAGAMALYARLRSSSVTGNLARWCALWLLAELARGVFFTGFPWGAAGYAHVDSPLAALLPWLGVYATGAVAAGLGALLGWSVQAGTGWPARAGAALLLAGLAALPTQPGPDFTRPTGTLSVTLLQTNVPQEQKFDFSHLPALLDNLMKPLLASRADLVIAPETAIPLLESQLPEGLWAALVRHFGQGSTHALIGIPMGNAEVGYTNSVAGLGPDVPGGAYRYDKHHLVPFGEFIPPGFRWFVDLMKMPLGDFARGPLVAPSFAVGRERIGPNICYEDVFGEELAARFVDEARAPTVLANVTNIGWFGRSVAIDQHLQIARTRTLELQRPMLRATNTGATVIIDHRGVVTHRLEPHVRAVLEGQVQGREGTTPFAWWAGRFGLAPLWTLALAVVGLSLWRRRRR